MTDAGTPVSGVAKVLRVSVSYVSKVLGGRRQTGETTARPQCGHVPAKLAGYHGAIRKRVAAVPGATLAELKAWLKQTHQVTIREAIEAAGAGLTFLSAYSPELRG